MPMRDVIGLTLAIGFVLALNFLTIAVLYDALFSNQPGLSENATQILTGWGGGVTGILGSMLGYRAGKTDPGRDEQTAQIAATAALTTRDHLTDPDPHTNTES